MHLRTRVHLRSTWMIFFFVLVQLSTLSVSNIYMLTVSMEHALSLSAGYSLLCHDFILPYSQEVLQRQRRQERCVLARYWVLSCTAPCCSRSLFSAGSIEQLYTSRSWWYYALQRLLSEKRRGAMSFTELALFPWSGAAHDGAGGVRIIEKQLRKWQGRFGHVSALRGWRGAAYRRGERWVCSWCVGRAGTTRCHKRHWGITVLISRVLSLPLGL